MKAMSPKAKKITKIVTDVIFWIFFAFALSLTVLAFTAQASPTGYPTVGNKIMLTVESDSMESKDGFKMGDMIICETYKTEEEDLTARQNEIAKLKEGDVITFKRDLNNDGVDELNSHRIVAVYSVPGFDYNKLKFQTKGDNLEDNDPYEVYDSEIVGKWTGKKLAGFGNFITFLQPPHAGFFIFIILPLAGFLAYEVTVLVINVKKMKAGDKRSITAAEEELIKQKAIEEFLKKQEAEKSNENK